MKGTALILGGTNPHIHLINKLKRRGYFTVLIDYLDNPPAKEYADIHVQASTLDKVTVLNIAKEYNASLVISTNIDHANTTACWVSEQLNLPHPYSYETSLNVTDKKRMKTILTDNNISTADFYAISNLDELNIRDLNYPVIIKPVDSNGSRGVFKCNTPEEILINFPKSLEESKSNKVIIEEFIQGEEISFYYYIHNKKPIYITSNQRIRFKEGTTGVIQSIGGIYPAPQSPEIYLKMHTIAHKIAEAFNLNNTPIFIQCIVADDNPYVIEFAPRIGGGLSYRLIENENKIDLIDATIDSFLGNDPNLKIVKQDGFAAVMNIYAPNIIMGEFAGINNVLDKNIAEEFYKYKQKGSEVSKDLSSGSRVGAFYIKADSILEIQKNINEINQNIEVYDFNGNPAMRHDIYQ